MVLSDGVVSEDAVRRRDVTKFRKLEGRAVVGRVSKDDPRQGVECRRVVGRPDKSIPCSCDCPGELGELG
jgi:hypothetical protein